MAKIGKTTFSNSHAATADSFTITDAQAGAEGFVQTLNLLSQGDPGSAKLYSIGVNNINGGASNMTLLPDGTSGKVAVPTDLLIQDSAGYHITSALGATVTISSTSSVSYDFHAIASTVDHLADGATLTDSFLYAIQMADGTVSWNTVSVTLKGSAAVVNISDDGVQEDVNVVSGNLTDTVSVDAHAGSGDATGFSVSGSVSNLGGLSPSTGSGHADLTYTVSNAAVQFLGAGETVDDHFTVTTTNGTHVDFTETILGTNDAAVFSAGGDSGSVTEDASAGATETDHGTLTFTDVDLHDTHTVTATGGTYGTLDSVAIGTDSTNNTTDNSGTVTWHYTVNNSVIDHLGAHDHVTDTFIVKLTETSAGDGSTHDVNQDVTIDIYGTNDTPVITSDPQSGSVSEGDGLGSSAKTATGQVTYTDADTSDSHTLSISAAAAHGTASVDPDGTWHYTVSDSGAVDALGAGDTLGDTFTVQVDDGNGGMVTQDVSITITGTNDAPMIDTTSSDLTGSVTEDDPSHETAAGNIVATDPDTGDHQQFSMSNDGQGAYGSLSIDSSGHWTYSLDENLAQNLNDGDHPTETFTITVTDDHNATDTVDVTVTVNGHTDLPPAPTDADGPDGVHFVFNGQAGDSLNLGSFQVYGDNDPDGITYSLVNNPPTGVSVDPNTGALVFAGNSAISDTTITVEATDGAGHSADTTFNLWVGSNTSGDTHSLVLSIGSAGSIGAGEGGGDVITGTSGVDYIYGGSAGDTIIGGGSGDFLSLGGGQDTVKYAAASASSPSAYDTISDFTGGSSAVHDFLDFSAIAAITGIQAGEPLSNGGTLHGHDIGWVLDGTGNTIVYANVTGSDETIGTNTDMEIHLMGVSNLSSTDIHV